jgi:DnaJ-class molecular chaperone
MEKKMTDQRKEVDYVKHFAKLIAKRFPEGDVDVASEVDSIQVDEGLEENDFISSMSFDSKVREKLSELWEKVDCDKCSGKGYYFDDDNDLINCPRCHGEGTLPKGER